MSQFAAQQGAGSPATPRSDGLDPHSGDLVPKHRERGTAHGFRLLQQRLTSTSIAHLLPLPEPVPALAREISPVLSDLPAGQPEIVGATVSADARQEVPALLEAPEANEIDSLLNVNSGTPPDQFVPGSRIGGIEAFDLTSLLDASQALSPVDVDLSAFDQAVSEHHLLVGTGPPPSEVSNTPWLDDPRENGPVLQPVQEDGAPQPSLLVAASTPPGAELQLNLQDHSPPQHEHVDFTQGELSSHDDRQPQDQTSPDTGNLRLLLEPALPSIDEFAVPEMGQFFATSPNAPSAAQEQVDAEPEQQSLEGTRSVHYRFWDAGREEEPLPEAAQLAAAEPFEDHMVALTGSASPQNLAPSAEVMDSSAEVCSPEVIAPEPVVEEFSPKLSAEGRRRAVILRQASEEPSEELGEVARSLLEIMSLPANTTQPQERALAADSLLHLVHRLPVRSLVAMAERLSLMEVPPPLILAELIHDRRIEVAGPLLERCSAINDHDLIEVIADGHQQSNRMIARRRSLTAVLCDALIATADTSAILTLVRNPGAMISHEAFYRLNELAKEHPSLQAPLATRSDLPAPVAFELFWVLPVELRRYVISRFLTDSSTLNKILKLTMRMDGDPQEATPDRFSSTEDIDRLLELLLADKRGEAEHLVAALLGLHTATAARILLDAQGEPLTVALKAMGATRARFEEIFSALHNAVENGLRPRRSAGELQGIFESLSFNKARVLLTYWDWAVLRTGPYAALSG